MELRAGSRIGKYAVLRVLGEGGMGMALAARHLELGRDVAIKVLHRRFAAREEVVLRLLREARAAAALRHPNVVDVLDIDRDDDGTPYIVLELLDGETLASLLRRRDRLPLEEARAMLLPVLDAVALAHARGIVHRDLKPENVFLHRDARGAIVPKVLDFGVAKAALDEAAITTTDALLGTPLYMAPEQFVSARDAGPPADVWSLGVIWFEALSGRRPFSLARGASPFEVIARITGEVPSPLASAAPDLDPRWAEAIDRALEREPARRYRDAGDMLEALRDLDAEPTAPASPIASTRPPHHPAPWRAAIAALATLVVVAIAWVVAPGAGPVAEPPALPDLDSAVDDAQRAAAGEVPRATAVQDERCVPGSPPSLPERVSGMGIEWAQTRAEVEARCGEMEEANLDPCRAPHVELRLLDGPLGLGGGSVQLAYASTEGLFEVLAKTERDREAVIEELETVYGEPVRTAAGARWDLGEARLTVATAEGLTSLRAFHRGMQRRYEETIEHCPPR